MAFEIVFDPVARVLRARYSGEVTLEERLGLARRILQDAERTGVYRLLLDFRDAQSRGADPQEVGRVADELSARLPGDARIAYLLRYDHQLDDSLEVAVRSRGVRIERFLDMTAAVAWLQQDDPPRGAGEPGDADLDHAFRLAAESVDPAARLSPEQLSVLGELVHELLATGMDEATILRLARRVSAAMHQLPGDHRSASDHSRPGWR